MNEPAAPPEATLFLEVVEHLEAAVLVFDAASGRLLLANAFAREALGVAADDALVPGSIAEALSAWFATAPPRSHFGASTRITAPNGRLFHARAKRLHGRPHAVLTLLTPHVVRDQDVREALRARFGLRQREVDVALAVRAGLTNSEIANQLGLSEGTVKNYLSRVFTAVGVRSRTHLLAEMDGLGAGR